jgi:hypothetical protein
MGDGALELGFGSADFGPIYMDLQAQRSPQVDCSDPIFVLLHVLRGESNLGFTTKSAKGHEGWILDLLAQEERRVAIFFPQIGS